MQTTIELTIKLPITFNILKGQPETRDNPGYEAEIIDVDFESLDASRAAAAAIKEDSENVDAQIWEYVEGERE